MTAATAINSAALVHCPAAPAPQDLMSILPKRWQGSRRRTQRHPIPAPAPAPAPAAGDPATAAFPDQADMELADALLFLADGVK